MKKKSIIILAIIALLLVALLFLLRNAGTWLIKSDPLKKADALVLLMGSVPDRVLQAADLYKQGSSGRLIIVEENMGAFRRLEERGIHILSNTTQCKNAAISLGVPADSITILPGFAASTQTEAVIIRKYASLHPTLDTITLVTSPDHTRRASMIFEKAFQKRDMHIVVYSSPSKYSSYTGKGWWKEKEGIQTVMFEYIKMINFWLFDKRNL